MLSTVYHLGRPIENIPYKYYLEFTEGRFRPSVEAAIPVCLGDSYEGFPVIGTMPEMFTKLQYMEGQKYEFATGRKLQRCQRVRGGRRIASRRARPGWPWAARSGPRTACWKKASMAISIGPSPSPEC